MGVVTTPVFSVSGSLLSLPSASSRRSVSSWTGCSGRSRFSLSSVWGQGLPEAYITCIGLSKRWATDERPLAAGRSGRGLDSRPGGAGRGGDLLLLRGGPRGGFRLRRRDGHLELRIDGAHGLADAGKL